MGRMPKGRADLMQIAAIVLLMVVAPLAAIAIQFAQRAGR